MAKKTAAKTAVPAKPKRVTSQGKNKEKYGDRAFSKGTVEKLATLSGWICNNPSCQSLTLGAADEGSVLATKVGEAAHIRGENGEVGGTKNSARWEDGYVNVGSEENGIWLCPSCHTEIDKNDGGSDAKGNRIFTVERLQQWKKDHLQMIQNLMLARRSPLPHLRSKTLDGEEAQRLVTAIGRKGAMYRPREYEGDEPVWRSVEALRYATEAAIDNVEDGTELNDLLFGLLQHFAEFMNSTSNITDWEWEQLLVLRGHVGIFLGLMEADYDCIIKGPITAIVKKKKLKKK